MKRLVIVLVVCFVGISVACSKSNNPLNPSNNDTGRLHISIDGVTCRGTGPASIEIDGTAVGTISPGDNGLTRDVSIGAHYISGSFLNYPGYGWKPFAVQVPESGFTQLLHC